MMPTRAGEQDERARLTSESRASRLDSLHLFAVRLAKFCQRRSEAHLSSDRLRCPEDPGLCPTSWTRRTLARNRLTRDDRPTQASASDAEGSLASRLGLSA